MGDEVVIDLKQCNSMSFTTLWIFKVAEMQSKNYVDSDEKIELGTQINKPKDTRTLHGTAESLDQV